jgi:RND family efflux transporter MFP subunit
MRPPLRKLARLAGAAVLCPALAAACRGGAAGDEGGAADGVQPAVAAQTAVVTAQPFTETVGAIGSVAPRAGHVATLAAPAPARVTRVFVATGAHVSTGQPLVQLDPALFQASAQSAEAALEAAQRSYERTRRLAQEGIAPRKDADQAAAELARARADAVAARRAVLLSTLRAPLAGVVTRMTAVLGATADPSQPLVEVADPSALDVLLNMTPGEAARVRAGAEVTLHAGQNATGEPLGAARVSDVAGAVDSATRSVAVRARTSAPRRPLRIGETVFGQVAVATVPNAIVVPIEALVPEGERFKVFVVDARGVALGRVVRVGGRTERVAEITEGLRVGERIVTYGAYGVEDSVKVVPVSPGARQGAAR